MEKLFYFLIDFNYAAAFFILVGCYIILQWILMFKNKDYKYIRKKYTNINSTDISKIKRVIQHLDGRQFEELCAWLFSKSGKYKSVILTEAERDGGKDIILDDEVYVECKRYADKATITEDFMIGREICQKLVGAMVADGFKKGIIMTTGNVHRNAWDYIINLEKNSPDIKIDFLLLDDIIKMIREINSTEIFDIISLFELQNEEILQ